MFNVKLLPHFSQRGLYVQIVCLVILLGAFVCFSLCEIFSVIISIRTAETILHPMLVIFKVSKTKHWVFSCNFELVEERGDVPLYKQT